MPPRIHISLPLRHVQPRWHRRLNPILPSAIQNPSPSIAWTGGQARSASILAQLRDNKGAYSPEKRRGRGPASGLGKTSGRGQKGQKARGKVPAGFEGGQTPQHIVHGSRGFSNTFSKDITALPLTRIQSWIAQGRIDPTRPITPLQLISSRCVHGASDGIKLLASSLAHDQSLEAQPPLSQALHIVVSQASAQAIAAVEAAGGTVTSRYYTRTAFRSIVAGRCHPAVSLRTHPDLARRLGATVEDDGTSAAEEAVAQSSERSTSKRPLASAALVRIRTGFPTRLPDPTSRRDIEFYRDPHRRGYLAHELLEGDSPSLYFKTQSQLVRERRERRSRNGKAAVETTDGAKVKKRSKRSGELVSLWTTSHESKSSN